VAFEGNKIRSHLPEEATYMEKHPKQLAVKSIFSESLPILLPRFESLEKVIFKETVRLGRVFYNLRSRMLELGERYVKAAEGRGILGEKCLQVEELTVAEFQRQFQCKYSI
jgi:hypothetical protein